MLNRLRKNVMQEIDDGIMVDAWEMAFPDVFKEMARQMKRFGWPMFGPVYSRQMHQGCSAIANQWVYVADEMELS